ncbi:MAG: YvcK family protein [Anaerolineales bacterium]|nr:YvcK family protein [Anaerolineales bacterium]MCB9127732.1 YvcK family protein [Ardenticatenales bacterium]
MQKEIKQRFEGLKPGVGVKRWLALIIVGIVQIAFAFETWLSGKVRDDEDSRLAKIATLGGMPRWLRIALLSASGSYATVVGWQRLSDSLMELMAPEGNDRQFSELIRERTRALRGENVVVIGGMPGIGPILQALQQLPEELRISVILPATASSRLNSELQRDFHIANDQIIQPTESDAVLYAELEDGTLVEGTNAIQRITDGQIKDLFLSRDIRRVQVWEAGSNGSGRPEMLKGYMPNVSDRVLSALAEAKLIIFAPGHVYTQLLPNLTQPRFAQAVRESSAPKLLVMNLMTQPGQTEGWSVADHLEKIDRLTGITMDYAFVHSGQISAPLSQQYANEGSGQVALGEESQKEMSELIFADTGKSTRLLDSTIIVSEELVSEAPQTITFQRNGDTIRREMPVVRHDPQKLAPLFSKLLNDRL